MLLDIDVGTVRHQTGSPFDYKIVTPSDIQFSVPEQSDGLFGTGLMSASTREPAGLTVEIHAALSERMIRSDTGLFADLNIRSQKLVQWLRRPDSNDADAECELIREDGSSGFARVVPHGNVQFRIDAYATEPGVFSAEDCRMILASFHPLADERSAEQLNSYEGNAGSKILFQYPQSWTLADHEVNVHGEQIVLESSCDGRSTGRMIVVCEEKSVTSSDAADMMKRYAETLTSQGARLSGSPMVKAKSEERGLSITTCVPGLMDEDSEFTAPTRILESESLRVLVGLVGTTCSESPYWWAVNQSAFDALCQTIEMID